MYLKKYHRDRPFNKEGKLYPHKISKNYLVSVPKTGPVKGNLLSAPSNIGAVMAKKHTGRGKRKGGYRKKGGKQHTKMSKTVVKTPSLVPDHTFVKLNYVDNTGNALIFGGTPYALTRTFRGNGVFDPDTSGGNFGCYGFKQYAALYNKMRVFSSKIRIRFVNVSGKCIRVVVWPSDLIPAATLNAVIFPESVPYAKSYLLPPTGSKSDMTMSHYMSSVKMEGDRGAEYDTTFASNTANIPSNQWYWCVAASDSEGANIAGTGVVTDIKITYYVEFYSRKDLSDTMTYFQAGEDPVEPIEPNQAGSTGPSGILHF